MISHSYNNNYSLDTTSLLESYILPPYNSYIIFMIPLIFHIYNTWLKPQSKRISISLIKSINIFYSLIYTIFCTTGYTIFTYFCITGYKIFWYNGLFMCNFSINININILVWHMPLFHLEYPYYPQQIWKGHLPRKLSGKDLVIWWNNSWLFCRFQILNYLLCTQPPNLTRSNFFNMDSLYAYSNPSIKGPTMPRSDDQKKKTRTKLSQAQTLQKSYETSIDKYRGTNPMDNILSLTLRSESSFLSSCILISGLPANILDWLGQRFSQWVMSAAHYLHDTLGVTIEDNVLNEYLRTYSNSPWVFMDGGSCSFPIPILPKTFHMGGGLQHSFDSPSAFGINPGDPQDPFYIYQAIPSHHPRDIFSLRSSVELCTFRGLPDHGEELKAVLSLIQQRVHNHISNICQLPLSSFYVVLHRRDNKRTHFLRDRPSHEFVVTVYCCPDGHSIVALRDKLSLKNAPSEANLDWIGEVWGSYYAIQSSPPSMILLHRTPRFCIRGFHASHSTTDIIKAFFLDNPNLQVLSLLYLWVGLMDPTSGQKMLVLVFNGEIPPLVLGVNLGELGAFCSDGDPLDNPSMSKAREIIAGIVLHYQFQANSSLRKGWTKGLKEMWSKQLDGILTKMPTLQGGHALGITHADSTAWLTQPSYFPPEANIRLLRQHSLPSVSVVSGVSSTSTAVSSYTRAPTTTLPPHGAHGSLPPEHYQDFFRQLLEDHAERLATSYSSPHSNKRSASNISDTPLATEFLSPLGAQPMDTNHDQEDSG